ncbi:hypothetical protein MUS1_13350 [Marinomonas ushuaiensis DSM 15871]|uniref:YdhG-like domain-containing protein n=1 Tax=Marinomonas ushuaiensis DSM 15871 TaxID=1122207 RepID=X7E536_9GAMM|nr:DUF1801 domain-containing protein [Marinomonas ushuaiensis]ETX10960.1 hypothetical protein MUS1_13350 [Marinomonas ushuaiensis DSM 15871]
MLTLPTSDFVRHYIQNTAPIMRADLLKVIEIMREVAPEAELVGDLGIPYFKKNASWLFGVAAREGNLCVFFADLGALHSFSKRLRHTKFGDNCLIIHSLDDVNINVFVELIGQMKVHFDLSNREGKTLIQ